MTDKRFNLTLIVENETTRLCAPSGHHWSYKNQDLPDWLFTITYRCLDDDSKLSASIRDDIKQRTEEAR